MGAPNQLALKILGDNGIGAQGTFLGTNCMASDTWFDVVTRQSRYASGNVRFQMGFGGQKHEIGRGLRLWRPHIVLEPGDNDQKPCLWVLSSSHIDRSHYLQTLLAVAG